MNVPVWAVQLASQFWERVGEAEPFPRKLTGPIALALPLAITTLPRLTLDGLSNWLNERGSNFSLNTCNRELRACVLVRNGAGFIFLDGTDPEDERRFSLAHELAHYLRDYLQPRLRIEQRLGPAALEVVDGLREPTVDERIHAVLDSTKLSTYVHWMERDEGGYATRSIAQAEDDADRLAFELLAPAEDVWEWHHRDAMADLSELLQVRYGLPATQSRRYGDLLDPRPRPRSRFLDEVFPNA